LPWPSFDLAVVPSLLLDLGLGLVLCLDLGPERAASEPDDAWPANQLGTCAHEGVGEENASAVRKARLAARKALIDHADERGLEM